MKRITQLFASKFEAKRTRIHFIKQKNAHRSESFFQECNNVSVRSGGGKVSFALVISLVVKLRCQVCSHLLPLS